MMDKTNLLLVGGGGHCRSVIESAERSGLFNIVGISDLPELLGTNVSGYEVVTSDENITQLNIENLHCLVTIGQIKTPAPRKKLFELLKSNKLKLSKVIDPSAIVSPRSQIGDGTVVLSKCLVNSGAKIGENCIINSGAMIEHDSIIGNHVHISTGVIINGDCYIGDECFIGSGAVISNGVSIASGTLIGAGCVIMSNIKIPGTYLGNPGRRIK